MIRILIADDHGIVRKGLIQILNKEYPFAQITEEVSSAELLVQEVIRSDWDVVISDLDMPGRGGMDALRLTDQATKAQASGADPQFPLRRTLRYQGVKGRGLRLFKEKTSRLTSW